VCERLTVSDDQYIVYMYDGVRPTAYTYSRNLGKCQIDYSVCSCFVSVTNLPAELYYTRGEYYYVGCIFCALPRRLMRFRPQCYVWC